MLSSLERWGRGGGHKGCYTPQTQVYLGEMQLKYSKILGNSHHNAAFKTSARRSVLRISDELRIIRLADRFYGVWWWIRIQVQYFANKEPDLI